MPRLSLAAIGLAVLLLRPRPPSPPPHALTSIKPAEIAAARLDGVELPLGSPGFAAAAALPARLAPIRPVADLDWMDVRTLQLRLRDGSTLWLQVMPDANGAWIRATADGPSKPSSTVASRIKAIRGLRLNGYHVPAVVIAPIVRREVVGKTGVAARAPKPTALSTRTKQD